MANGGINEVFTHTTLNNGREAILTEDILAAAATIVASGNYTAEAAVDMALKLNDILVERLKGSY